MQDMEIPDTSQDHMLQLAIPPKYNQYLRQFDQERLVWAILVQSL